MNYQATCDNKMGYFILSCNHNYAQYVLTPISYKVGILKSETYFFI